MDIVDLPVELQNKIFFMFAEHPLASIFKKHVKTENCIVYTERENRERIETARYIVMTIKDEKKEDPKQRCRYKKVFTDYRHG